MTVRPPTGSVTPLVTVLLAALAGTLMAGYAGGFQLSAPSQIVYAASKSDDQRMLGSSTFQTKGCIYCHGVNAAGIPDKGPDLSTVGKRLKKEAIMQQIVHGGGGMPAFGTSLQPDEMEALVAFLSAKKKPLAATP